MWKAVCCLQLKSSASVSTYILKRYCFFNVNKRLSSTRWTTLYFAITREVKVPHLQFQDVISAQELQEMKTLLLALLDHPGRIV